MGRGGPERSMGQGNGCGVGDILSNGLRDDPFSFDPLVRPTIANIVRRPIRRAHAEGMGSGEFIECRIPYEGSEPFTCPREIHHRRQSVLGSESFPAHRFARSPLAGVHERLGAREDYGLEDRLGAGLALY